MPVKKPSLEELGRIAAAYHWEMSEEDLAAFRQLMGGVIGSYARLDELTAPMLEVKHSRSTGYRPQHANNPLGAWYWRCEIQGPSGGPLTGKTVAIKDSVCVAGIPMMMGSSVMEGFVPDQDATIVTRMLDAGCTLMGKAVCESTSHGGGSHTADTGPVRNPYDLSRSTGGSSSGSAALVASGEVDIATGGDQGGSIRIPASWCGIYGLKPTYGLVPYTGIFPMELTLDHTGPFARSVVDIALFLEVTAGSDGFDPRQAGGPPPQAYTAALTGNVNGLRLGIVEEGFGLPGLSEDDVDEAVHESAHAFERLGARVEPTSIPWHRDAVHVWNAIAIEGLPLLMASGNGMGSNWKGHYMTSMFETFARGRIARGNDLSPLFKLNTLLGQYMRDNYHGHYYAKSQNLVREVRRAYDLALEEFDLLIMPTTPMKATPLPPPDCSMEEYVVRSEEMVNNTAPFCATGHPSMSVPCAVSNGLPIGMMLTGRLGDDSTVLRAAQAFESEIFPAPAAPKIEMLETQIQRERIGEWGR